MNQRRRGVLTAIYDHLSKNLKAGVGYNFTNFSDELTDLKYNHRAYSLIWSGPSDGDRAPAW